MNKFLYNSRKGTVGEYMAVDFLRYQSFSEFGTCPKLEGKTLDHISHESRSHYHGCDILATASERFCKRLRDKYLNYRTSSAGDDDFTKSRVRSFLEKKRVMAQVFEVKTSSAQYGSPSLQGHQRNFTGIHHYLELAKKSNSCADNGIAAILDTKSVFHSYLIHVHGIGRMDANRNYDVYLDLYDWGQCIFNSYFTVSYDDAVAKECRIGGWKLDLRRYRSNAEAKNDKNKWYGQPFDPETATESERFINAYANGGDANFLNYLLSEELNNAPSHGTFWENAHDASCLIRTCYSRIKNLPWIKYC